MSKVATLPQHRPDGAARGDRARRVVSVLLAYALSIVVGVLLLELLFGGWFDPSRLNRLNLIKGRTIRFEVGGLYDSPEPTVTYTRDRFGLRGDYGGDPARIELLTVGGSTTDQRYVSDGATWQDVLRGAFAAEGRELAVANAGVDGQSTVGHLADFDWWFPGIPGLRPRAILFYVGLNDFHVDLQPNPKDALVREETLTVKLAENSAFWHLARTVKGVLAAAANQVGHYHVDFAAQEWVREPLQRDYAFLRPLLDAYAQRVELLIDRAEAMGARPLFVTQPARWWREVDGVVEGRAETSDYAGRAINGVDRWRMMRAFDGALRDACARRGVAFFDLAVAAPWSDDDFYDYVHMTPAGAKKVGLLLHRRLRGEL